MQETLWSNLCRSEFHTDVNSFVKAKSKGLKSAKALYVDFATAKQKHLRQLLLSHRAEILQQRFNIEHTVAFDLLTKYA